MRMTLPTGIDGVGCLRHFGFEGSGARLLQEQVRQQCVGLRHPERLDGHGNKTDKDSVLVTITASPSEYDGKTQIHIVHTTSTKAS